ncbi:transmembrane protein 116-like [Antedon mediterranea]|uniref:transmembrane protein 116-like n=1 Tax=Antedon mediterranea TaxID=105859 RepID=UPI003AF46A92
MGMYLESEASTENPNIFYTNQLEVISYIQICTSLLSIFGAGSVILVVLGKRKVRSQDVYPLFNLCLADLLASLFIFSSAVTYTKHTTGGTVSESCAITTGFAAGFYMSSFSLSALYAYEVYLRVKSRLQSKRYSISSLSTTWYHRFNLKYLCYVLSWVVPVAGSVALMITVQDEGSGDSIDDPCANYECLLMFHQQNDLCLNSSRLGDEGRIVAKVLFIVPLILAMVAILVIYILTFKLFRKVQKSGGVFSTKQHEAVTDVRNKGLMYSAVFTFCWIPALVLGVISLSDHVEVQNIYWLVIVQCLTATLQGFLNCVIYGWNRRNFRAVKSRKDSYISVKYSTRNNNSYGSLQDASDPT